MKGLDDWFDRALMTFVRRVPGRVVAVVALAFYGAGIAIPVAFDWSGLWVIDANVFGTMAAAAVAIGWLQLQLEARDRRHLVEWTSDLRLLDAAEFEWLVAELFRREGWEVAVVGRQDGPDGNVDVRMSRGTERRLVQCKRWTARLVGVDEIRAFAGTLLREGRAGGDGVFVTLSGFTEQARAEAKTSGLELLDGRGLYHRVAQARRAEPCPTCGQPMLLDRSQHGWWLRCVADACSGKRDLGRDPGRAVELLTEAP